MVSKLLSLVCDWTERCYNVDIKKSFIYFLLGSKFNLKYQEFTNSWYYRENRGERVFVLESYKKQQRQQNEIHMWYVSSVKQVINFHLLISRLLL